MVGNAVKGTKPSKPARGKVIGLRFALGGPKEALTVEVNEMRGVVRTRPRSLPGDFGEVLPHLNL